MCIANIMIDYIVVVMHTVEKETLFPEKLKMVNEMLSKTKFLDSEK